MSWGGGDIPALSAGNVRMGFIDFSEECYLGSEALYSRWMTRGDVEKDDIVFTTEAPLGNVALIPDDRKYILSQRTVLLKIDPRQAVSRFVFQLMLSEQFQKVLADNSSGTTAKGIQRKSFELLKVVCPSLPEQHAIATALSDVDALLGALEQLIAKKRDLKQAAMQQLLTSQTRLPGFDGEWDLRRLGDIARIQRGASPRPIDSPVWFDESSDIGWVRISDVTKSGMYLRETTQRLSQLGAKHSRPVARGSLIMSICATVGRPIVTEIDVCIHDGFVVFDDLQADKLFIYYMLKWIEPDWSKHGQTGSQMNLNTGLIAGTEIALPSLPEQAAIAAVLSDMDAELVALEQRLAKTRALKQGMMQELLTGRTRLV
ncbi:TPA: restriction endonuclease subunit S [Pseudomonas aeruginosa]|nr:restriction endonuclease subunit S [Pseudomonas aeruginosa]MBI8609432.1 restriction endonuclease subunit S [Pseudomonas aeruginosa]MCV0279899.1 restriction endonuclease subunit S [Pseudomonas aeruginosa]HBO3489830.1 restriction endonuclease subunit S [Pseudomonas aeruginosa]HBP0747351.1 restriction endonuclease subunit S [Pseudomonas aeruginosa]